MSNPTRQWSRMRRYARRLGPGTAVSESRHRAIDREIHRIVAGARADAIALLRHERRRLDHLAAALLEHETLDQDAAYRAAGLEPPTRPAPLPLAA